MVLSVFFLDCRFVLCLTGVGIYCRNPESQLAFPLAQDEVYLFAGSPLAALRMTCCVHTLRPSLQVMRERSWTSST
jgi:hypothetical protein